MVPWREWLKPEQPGTQKTWMTRMGHPSFVYQEALQVPTSNSPFELEFGINKGTFGCDKIRWVVASKNIKGLLFAGWFLHLLIYVVLQSIRVIITHYCNQNAGVRIPDLPFVSNVISGTLLISIKLKFACSQKGSSDFSSHKIIVKIKWNNLYKGTSTILGTYSAPHYFIASILNVEQIFNICV